jgi:photosystem II stability/assembly factor-like uncharacterized protein
MLSTLRRTLPVVTLFLLGHAFVVAQWTRTNGPGGGGTYCLALSNGAAFEAGGGGVYFSSNRGASWTSANAGLPDGNIVALAAVPAGTSPGAIVYAATFINGVFRSTDYGEHWNQVDTLPGNPHIYSLAVTDSTLYIGVSDKVFISRHAGRGWYAVDVGLPFQSAFRIAASGERVMVSDQAGVSLSIDKGLTWRSVGGNMSVSTAINALAIMDTILLAATGGQGIFRSTDDGKSWSAPNEGLWNTHFNSIAVGRNAIYAASDPANLYLSVDGGTSWVASSPDLHLTTITALAAYEYTVLAGTLFEGMFVTTNGAGSWNAANIGTRETVIKVMAKRGSTIYAGTDGNGVSFTTTRGDDWIPINTGLKYDIVAALAMSDRYMFAGTRGGGVFRSTNGGASWVSANSGMTGQPTASGMVNDVVADGENVYRATDGAGLYRSTDAGLSWIQSGLASQYILALALTHPTGGSNLFAGVGGGLFRSTNSGSDWIDLTSAVGQRTVWAFAVTDTIVFAVTADVVYRSTDNGATWIDCGLVRKGFFRHIAADGDNVLVTGDLTGLHLSTDMGVNWTTDTTTFPPSQLTSILVSGTDLFAGTSGLGVWRRPFEPAGTSINPSISICPVGFNLDQNYPNPFNPTTVISYQLPVVSNVRLGVYDLLGREVAVLVNERKAPGSYEVKFDGAGLASGVYFYRLSVSPLAIRDLVTQGRDGQMADFVLTRKLLIIR